MDRTRTLMALLLATLCAPNAWAGPQYRVVLQNRADADAGVELFIASDASFADRIGSPAAVGGDFSGIDIAPAYRIAALGFEPAAQTPPNAVSEPPAAALLLLGLAALAGTRRLRGAS